MNITVNAILMAFSSLCKIQDVLKILEYALIFTQICSNVICKNSQNKIGIKLM